MTEDTPERPVPGAPGNGEAEAAAPEPDTTSADEARSAGEAPSADEDQAAGTTEEPVDGEPAADDEPAEAEPAGGAATDTAAARVAEPSSSEAASVPSSSVTARRRRRDPLASALIGILTLLLGFAFAVQVRSADSSSVLAGAREEDLVRILDELNSREERLREQITEQRTALEQLTNSDSQSATALDEAKRRAEAIGILNGTLAARGPGLRMTVRDPGGAVRVEDVLDAIEELRGAGAETMQIGGVRVGVSTAVTGGPGHLMIDGRPITAPYEFLVIGSPQNMETAMNIPGGVVQRITGLGGSVSITQVQNLTVDALRPLDTPQYAAPTTGN